MAALDELNIQPNSSAGRTVVIIGGGRGIGLGLVQAYLDRGMNVIATMRKANEALNALENLTVIEGIDVTDDGITETLSNTFEDQSIDIVIYNAGVVNKTWGQDGIIDVSDGKWVFDVNVWGAVRTMNALMSKVKSGGQIMLMSSSGGQLSSGIYNSSLASSYFMSKTTLNAYGNLITGAMRAKNVAVALMHPGYVQSDMSAMTNQKPGDVFSFPNCDVSMTMITVEDSARQIVAVMDKVTIENTGTYWAYDGTVLDW